MSKKNTHKLASEGQIKIDTNLRIEAYRKRREDLLFHAPRCPKCLQSSRVRLEEYIFIRPARWRCMQCNHAFEYEAVHTEE
jgi:transposase-like protein